ncbi:MAG: PAS domain S-box protein [Alkalispirochaeta sp.]
MARTTHLTADADLQTLFAVTPDLLCVIDARGTLLTVNSAWTRILGYEIDEVEGSALIDLIHPEDRPGSRGAITSLRGQDGVVTDVHRLKARDGAYRFVEWRARRQGELIYASGRDVTDTRELNQQLQLLSQAVEYSPATVVITDVAGTIEYVNKTFREMSGYSSEEMLGKNVRVLNAGLQDRTSFRGMWDTISSGKTWRGIFQNRTKAGEIRWESAVVAPVMSDQGTISHFMSLTEDVTTRRESAELMDLLFKQSLDGFFFMMLDEPVEWGADTDKEAVLDYVFAHQRITRINQAMLDQYGAQEDDFLGLTPADFFAHDMDHGRAVWRDFFDNGALHIDTREQKFNGESMVIEGDYICLYDQMGRIRGHFGVQRDVTFEREARQRLEASETKFRQLAENIPLVFFLRTNTEIVYVSPAYETIWGRSCRSLYDHPESFIEAIHPEDRDALMNWQRTGEMNNSIEYRIVRPDGEVRWIWATTFPVQSAGGESSEYGGRMAGLAQDVTDRKILEEQLRLAATRDALTGLINRRHLMERMEPLWEKAQREASPLAVAVLDVDHFKAINDSHGHSAGDVVLQKLAALMIKLVRSYDLVARYGGEEFVLVFGDTTASEGAKQMERVLAAVREMEIPAGDAVIRFTFSCGVADSQEAPSGDATVERLINRADRRLYQAKDSGRNRIVAAFAP